MQSLNMKMNQNTKNMLIVGIVCLLLVIILKPFGMMEEFNHDTTTFVPIGQQRHGLRGDKLHSHDIARNYIRPDRHIRLNSTNGWMYASDRTPAEEGIKGCTTHGKGKCVSNKNEYDSTDTCWNCQS
jgi:hypothetical protein